MDKKEKPINGVVLTEEVIAMSAANKAKKPRTTAQLPAFRAASNLLFSVVQIIGNCPRKLSRYTDKMMDDSTEIAKSIALANESRDEERMWYISNAKAMLYVLRNYFVILNRMEIISKDRCNKLRGETDKLIAQLVAWRDFTDRQGANAE